MAMRKLAVRGRGSAARREGDGEGNGGRTRERPKETRYFGRESAFPRGQPIRRCSLRCQRRERRGGEGGWRAAAADKRANRQANALRNWRWRDRKKAGENVARKARERERRHKSPSRVHRNGERERRQERGR